MSVRAHAIPSLTSGVRTSISITILQIPNATADPPTRTAILITLVLSTIGVAFNGLYFIHLTKLSGDVTMGGRWLDVRVSAAVILPVIERGIDSMNLGHRAVYVKFSLDKSPCPPGCSCCLDHVVRINAAPTVQKLTSTVMTGSGR